MRLVCSWNEANIEHVAKHGVATGEAEYVIDNAGRGFPRRHVDDKWLAWGQTSEGRYLQVIFVFPTEDEIDVDSLTLSDLMDYSEGRAQVAYVIHAMDLPDRDKHGFRKRR